MKKTFKKILTQLRTALAPQQILGDKGFTLIEMMIVVAIIGLLAGLVGMKVFRSLDESKVTAARVQIRQLRTVLDDFRRVCGSYPTTDQNLDALISAPASGHPCKNYPGDGFLDSKKVPQDPWNNNYVYTSDGNKYELKSLGKDGKEGGDGIDKDLSSEDAN